MKINSDLFEIRFQSMSSQWRAIYAYAHPDRIVILSIFNKKSTKLPKRELNKALQRLRKYQ